MKIGSLKSVNLYKSVVQTSYDIEKAHGGQLSAKTDQKNGSVFIIKLPIT